MFRSPITIAVIIIITVVCIGCSGNSNDITTPKYPDSGEVIAGETQTSEDGHILGGIWNIHFNPDDQTAEITPARDALYHYPVRYYLTPPHCDDCLRIHTNSWDSANRIGDFDVTLKNPYLLIVYDVRGIVYTTDDGHLLLNPDSWTDLFDIPGGEEINPFRMYARDTIRHAFIPFAEHTENLRIYLPESVYVQFAITAHLDGNCPEPYMIDNFSYSELLSDVGSQADLTVDVFDWQDDVDSVVIKAAEITGNPSDAFTHIHGTQWKCTITNNTGASEGYYNALIIAESGDAPTTSKLYKPVEIYVGETALVWANTWGGISPDRAHATFVYQDSYVYVVGYFNDTVDFDPGGGIEERVSNGESDIFLVKYNTDGDLIWVRTWGGIGVDIGSDLFISEAGYLYVTGQFRGTVDFDPGDGIEERTAVGDRDAFLAIYDDKGNLASVKTWGGASSDYGTGIAVDSNFDVVVTGSFTGTVDFNPDGDPATRTSNGMHDIYAVKFDAGGEFQWVQTWGGSLDDGGYAICIGDGNSVYVTGQYHTGSYSACLVKFDQNGTLEWSHVWASSGSDAGRSVKFDGTDGILVTGWFTGQIDLNPGPGSDIHYSPGDRSVYVSKFNVYGEYQWGKSWGSTGRDFGTDLILDADRNIYICGFFSGTADFDPGPGEDIRYTDGGADIFVTKLNSSGDYIGALTWGGSADDSAESIFVTTDNYIYVCGGFHGTVDMDPGQGVDEHTSNGSEDAFLVKLRPIE